MFARLTLIFTAAALLTACAEPYRIKPLPVSHPANPQAEAAPTPAPSDALAYDEPIEAPSPATMPGHDMPVQDGAPRENQMQHHDHREHE